MWPRAAGASSWLLVAQAHATQEPLDPSIAGRTSSPSASSHSITKPLIVTALRHKTSVTRRMCSLSRVMSVGESKVFLPSGSAGDALRFPRQVDPVEHPGAQALDFSQAPQHAPPPLCPPHWSNMSRNQSRTMGSTWNLRRFAVLLLGSYFTSAAAGVGGAAGVARGVLTWAISSCESGRSMVSPGRHQTGRCKRTPCGSSWWWKMCF